MKPQTGILISVHSYSKQYIQFYESQCATDSHTGGFVVKVPDIQQYTYTSMFYVTSLGRGLLGAKVSRASRDGEGEAESTDEDGLS